MINVAGYKDKEKMKEGVLIWILPEEYSLRTYIQQRR